MAFQIFEFLAKKLEASPQKCRFWNFSYIKKRVQDAIVGPLTYKKVNKTYEIY